MRRLVLLLAAATLLFGCNSSTTGPDEAEDEYTLRDEPGNAIVKLNEAYVAMDSAAYLDCLADGFEFVLSEIATENDSSLPAVWGFDAEQTIHRRMFGDEAVQPEYEVEEIALTLTTITEDYSDGADPDDPADDRWTYLVDVDLTVWLPNDLQHRASAATEMTVRVDPDETGPDGETLYEIVVWEDLASRQGRAEGDTWTGIKAIFRPEEVEDPYTLRDSPENTIARLGETYEAMDCDAYLGCLADSFQFHLSQIDVDNDSTLPEYWGREMERTIHRRMFGDEAVAPDYEVLHIAMTLDPGAVSHDGGADPDDPQDDTWTSMVGVDLWVTFPNDLVRRANPTCRFILAVDPDETGPDGETLYDIVELDDTFWEWEVREGTTWGNIKAMYR